MTSQSTVCPHSTDCFDEVRQSFLDTHLWLVEEELRTCLGRPPWFDSALCFVAAEILRDFACCKPPKRSVASWIRSRARGACELLELTLPVRRTQNGIVKFTTEETFAALVCSVLQRKRALYWEELHLPKAPLSRCGQCDGED